MKLSVKDVGITVVLESQLRSVSIKWMSINPVTDFIVGEEQFAVFFANLFKDSLFDAWLIVGGGSSGYYNFSNYPTVRDAVSQHIGRLVLEKKFSFVEVDNAKRPRKRRSSQKPSKQPVKDTSKQDL